MSRWDENMAACAVRLEKALCILWSADLMPTGAMKSLVKLKL